MTDQPTEYRAPIDPLPPKEQWADDGDPRITDWCAKCKARVVALATGYCGWCDAPVTVEARGDALRRQMNRSLGRRKYPKTPPTPKTRPARVRMAVLDALAEPKTVVELAEVTGRSRSVIRHAVSELVRRREVKAIDSIKWGKRSRLKVYALADYE